MGRTDNTSCQFTDWRGSELLFCARLGRTGAHPFSAKTSRNAPAHDSGHTRKREFWGREVEPDLAKFLSRQIARAPARKTERPPSCTGACPERSRRVSFVVGRCYLR